MFNKYKINIIIHQSLVCLVFFMNLYHMERHTERPINTTNREQMTTKCSRL